MDVDINHDGCMYDHDVDAIQTADVPVRYSNNSSAPIATHCIGTFLCYNTIHHMYTTAPHVGAYTPWFCHPCIQQSHMHTPMIKI